MQMLKCLEASNFWKQISIGVTILVNKFHGWSSGTGLIHRQGLGSRTLPILYSHQSDRRAVITVEKSPNSLLWCFNHYSRFPLDGICNYFLSRTTSGVMEGINNKLKLIKRQAYGFVNFDNFRARLLACFSH